MRIQVASRPGKFQNITILAFSWPGKRTTILEMEFTVKM